MTRSEHLAAGRSDVDWLLAEMEREGLPRAGQERLLSLIGEIVERGGLRRCEVRTALRLHVSGALTADDLPAPGDQVLAAVAILNPRTMKRAQRLARAVQLVKQGKPLTEACATLQAQYGICQSAAWRLFDMARDLAGEVEA